NRAAAKARGDLLVAELFDDPVADRRPLAGGQAGERLAQLCAQSVRVEARGQLLDTAVVAGDGRHAEAPAPGGLDATAFMVLGDEVARDAVQPRDPGSLVRTTEATPTPPRLSKRFGEQIVGHRRVAGLREQPPTKRLGMALEQDFERRGLTASRADQLDVTLLDKRLRRMLHLPGKWPQSTKRYGRSRAGAAARPHERPPLVQQIVHWLARVLRAMVGHGHDDVLRGHDDVLRAGLRSNSLGAG